MRKTIFTTLAAAAATFVIASPASAATACANTDISPNALDCSGFYDGNLLSGSPADITAQTAALADLGFAWDGVNVEKIDSLGGSHTVDFDTLLVGISYIGLHFGKGVGGPGNATAFYKIDGGAGLDAITLAYNASSGAVLYGTGAVPEPATWAMMIAGFGLVGGAMRRRKTRIAVTYA